MYACLYAQGNVALLAECARFFSPRFEESSADSMLVDLRGSRLLFGSPEEIAAAMINRAGIPVNLAIANDPDTASFVARGLPGITLVPPGREAAALAPLPLYLLPASPEVAAMVNAWGIQTFGELAALPSQGIASRLGNEGVYLQRLTRGLQNRQLRPVEEALQFEEEFELDSPVELMESLSFLLGRLLNSLCGRLASQSLATDEITLSLTLENAPLHSCTLRLPLPMGDPKVFLKLLQLELNSRPPVAAVLKICLCLKPTEPRIGQRHLFLATGPEPEKLEITLSKLSYLLGAENVGAPELLNTHRPDSFRMNRFTVVRSVNQNPLPTQPALVLRRYRPLKHAQVISQNQRPVHVRSLSLQGRVVDCLGPWRTSGDWWKAEPWDRREWDIALHDGAIYRLHQDIRTGHWFLEGVYD